MGGNIGKSEGLVQDPIRKPYGDRSYEKNLNIPRFNAVFGGSKEKGAEAKNEGRLSGPVIVSIQLAV